MKIFDTHTHLYSERIISDFETYFERQIENNVVYMLNTADSLETFDLLLKQQKENKEHILLALGIHPEYAYKGMEYLNRAIEYIENHIDNLVAIGEIGLDYHYENINDEYKQLQRAYFIKQIELARKYNLPIVIHERDACEDCFNIVKEYCQRMKVTLHCYSSSVEMAKRYIDTKIDIHFGIGGIVTFKNANNIVKVCKEIPLKYLLTETDAPYLTPVPYRGKLNESRYINYVVEKISEIKEIDLETCYNTLFDNAYNLYIKGTKFENECK